MTREARKQAIADRMQVELEDGVRYVWLDGGSVGRLFKDPRTGRWLLAWRPDPSQSWHELQPELDGTGSAEVAELWAVEEVAGLLAMATPEAGEA